MHTLLIHQAFVSPQEAGGTRHFELARALAGRGLHFTVVAASTSYLTGRAATAAAVEEYEGVTVLRAYAPPVIHRSFVWRVGAFLTFMVSAFVTALRVRRVDVVMGTTPPMFQAVSAWLVAALTRRPFLLEIRDLWPDFAIALGVLRHPILIRLARWLERFLYARATHLLVNSPAYRDYLIAHGVAPERVTLIPNGVDVDLFDPAATGVDLRRELEIEDAFVVMYAGALGLANDLDTVLDAASLLRDAPDVRIVLVGDGKERPRLRERSAALGLDNVIFAGPRPKQAIPGVLAAADLCLATLRDIPEFRTTYPNKVFDYMAAGRPVLLGIDGVIRQVVEAAGAGVFVAPGDATALAEAVRRLRVDPRRARAMGDAGRRAVAAGFNRRDQAEAFYGLLRTLTGSPRRAA